jgi:predicted glycosyltransferase
VLLYAHDGFGIGHLVRGCVLAAAIRRRWPSADVCLATGSPVARCFLPAGVRLAALPSYPVVPEHLAPPALRALKAERRRLAEERRRLLLELVRGFGPRVALVDHMPLGKRNELLPAVLELHERGARLLLGYRRIAEDVAATRSLLGHEPVRAALASHFAAVLVYAPAWVAERLGPLPGIDIAQTHVGFVCRQAAASRTDARRLLGLAPDDVVFACGLGGGRHAWPLAKTLLSAWSRARPLRGRLLFYLGPLLEPDEGELSLLAGLPGLRLLRGSTEFPLGIAAADAVVSTGGYNSVLESLRQGRRLFIIPNQKTEVEQERSAELLAELGMARVIRQGDGWQSGVEEAFASPVDEAVPRLPESDFRGDRNAAELIGCLREASVRAVG